MNREDVLNYLFTLLKKQGNFSFSRHPDEERILIHTHIGDFAIDAKKWQDPSIPFWSNLDT
jgi:hypothetical protein